ncbi:hypothetical protein ASZ78_002091 [Callipepla squamata]|uniref:Uncharacterized protein n=1 Tax=Callipepla squamata TaxID=9009 RepID=A0A226N9F5_CALSU|nr:hypothetical protein ASZ78_002091 [Callipepla squamata]
MPQDFTCSPLEGSCWKLADNPFVDNLVKMEQISGFTGRAGENLLVMWPGEMPPCDHYTKELFVSGSCTVRNGSFSPNCPCSNDANDDTATWWSPSRHRSKCTTAHSSLDNNTFPLYDAPFR